MGLLSTKLPFDQLLTKWTSELNPIIANPLNNVSILKNIKLNDGITVINHLLGKTQQGWYFTDINGSANVYRSSPFNSTTLSLTSNAAVTVSIAVF